MSRRSRAIGSVRLVAQTIEWEPDWSLVPTAVQRCPVVLNGRLMRTIGRAVSRGELPHKIELSRALWSSALIGTKRETLAHEVAHLSVGNFHGHDEVWADRCRALGGTGRRYAPAGTRAALGTQAPLKLVAVCDRCGYELWRRQRLHRGSRYRHRDCGGSFDRL